MCNCFSPTCVHIKSDRNFEFHFIKESDKIYTICAAFHRKSHAAQRLLKILNCKGDTVATYCINRCILYKVYTSPIFSCWVIEM